ncbi:MAG: choice-of-anchor tandem repeat NxxGxxAF-containing protein [Pirellulales bacterium]
MKQGCRFSVLCFSLLSFSTATSGEMLRTVALTGDQAPGLPAGVTYGRLIGPVMNSAGQIAFTADLSGTGVNSTNNSSIWSEGSGTLALVAREGSHAPGAQEGVTFRDFNDLFPQLNDAGQIAFVASLSGNSVDSTNGEGIWSGGTNSLALVIRSDDPAPGMPNGTKFVTWNPYNVYLDNAGKVAITAVIAGEGFSGPHGPNASSIWVGDSNSLSLVTREGASAPGTPDGVDFHQFYFDTPVYSTTSRIAFAVDVGGPGVDGTNREGIWSGSADSQTLLTRAGNHAPGTPNSTNFAFFGEYTVNSAGRTMFRAYLTGAGVDDTNEFGVWSDRSGSLALLAREGDHVPGMPDGTNFKDLYFPYMNSTGQIAFVATLAGGDVDNTNAVGLWSDRSGILELVCRSGDRPPSTPSGIEFIDFDNIVLNSAGQMAFVGYIRGEGIHNFNDFGVWAEDRWGTLRLIGRVDDALQVAPGDIRTIDSIFLSGFNDAGQLAFWARFTDGSQGIFITNLAAVPEPTSLLLVFAATSILACRRAPAARIARRL